MSDGKQTNAVYLDAEGRRVDVGQIVETTPAGLVVEMIPTLTSMAGTVVQR